MYGLCAGVEAGLRYILLFNSIKESKSFTRNFMFINAERNKQ